VNRNADVDRWFEQNRPADPEAMRRARDIILASDRVTETIKWSTPTFAYKGNIVSFTPAKSGVGLMFHRGAEIPDDHPRMEGDNRLVRTMRFTSVDHVESGRAAIEHAITAWCDWSDSETGVGAFPATFREFPTSQNVGCFSLDNVLESMQQSANK
jgi:hypothetical protein